MKSKAMIKTVALAAMLWAAQGQAHAQAFVRLGNLNFPHSGAASYIQQIAPKCGLTVDEPVFATRLAVMQALIAGQLDVGTTASDQPCKDVQLVYLAFADLNQALLGKNLYSFMQSGPQSCHDINKGYGGEVNKHYETHIGALVRIMVMSEKL